MANREKFYSDKQCTHDSCERAIGTGSRGYCTLHYQRHRRGVDMDAPTRDLMPRSAPYPECFVDGCNRTADTKRPGSMCGKHRNHMSRFGHPNRTTTAPGQIPTCSVIECENPRHSRALCNAHQVKSSIYNLSPVQLDMLYRSANFECRICKMSLDFGDMHIDHDHACCPGRGSSCGQCVRGILCMGCNVGLGAFGDDPDRLASAIRYLNGE